MTVDFMPDDNLPPAVCYPFDWANQNGHMRCDIHRSHIFTVGENCPGHRGHGTNRDNQKDNQT